MQDLLMKLFMKLQGQNCLKLNGCETSECKVACGYKLPAKYVFHPMRPRDKNDYRLNDCYKSCLQKALPYNVRYIVFYCRAIVIAAFDPRNAPKMAPATVRLWLESNHFSTVGVIFCTCENADYEIYKDLMSSISFPE